MPLTVTVYSTPTCPFCRMEKLWLEKNEVQYKNIFVNDDEKAAEVMIDKSKQTGVPVTIIADKTGKETVIIGFDKPRLATALGITE